MNYSIKIHNYQRRRRGSLRPPILYQVGELPEPGHGICDGGSDAYVGGSGLGGGGGGGRYSGGSGNEFHGGGGGERGRSSGAVEQGHFVGTTVKALVVGGTNAAAKEALQFVC
ncbi:hypothetical protein Sjap_007007 [Stephania japonica]|uniref:Uncharacterized protein n=1 Tax=Stephania japonica TaxID=461633 RepID=A0AAP0K8G4_9MAGN